MKFISKNLNLRLVLQPSMPAVPLAGQPAKNGVYVKFEGGVATIDNEEIVQKLLIHPAYNIDFVAVGSENQEQIAIAAERAQRAVEPEHEITQVQFGHIGQSLNPKPPVKLTPEVQEYLTKVAATMATEMFAKMVDSSRKAAQTPEKVSEPAPASTFDQDIKQTAKPKKSKPATEPAE